MELHLHSTTSYHGAMIKYWINLPLYLYQCTVEITVTQTVDSGMQRCAAGRVTQSATQRHTPQDMNPQQHRCDHLKSRTKNVSYQNLVFR
jgi:hypothetical protein